jgi:hypothetical protein
MTTHPTPEALADELESHVHGRTEWRVQDPASKSYCISFDRDSSLNPEHDAREWLSLHISNHPDSPKAKYEVAEVHWFTDFEDAAKQAAATLRTLSAELAQAKTDLHIATDDAAQMLASTQALSAELAAARAELSYVHQAISDPENQPSQFGTVTLEMHSESEFVIDKMSKLLAETVVILRGPEPPLKRWSYHDIPEQVAALKAERDSLRAERDGLARWKSTHAPRIEALQGLKDHAQAEAAKGAEALASLASEREANAILTAEAEALRADVDAQKLDYQRLMDKHNALHINAARARAEVERLKPRSPTNPFEAAAQMEPKPCNQCSGTMRGSTNGYTNFLRCDQCGAVPMPSQLVAPPVAEGE